jgi:hypothetical protein
MNFNSLYKYLLEDLYTSNSTKVPMGQGPNINTVGALPAGFKGANLPGIAPASTSVKIKKKKKFKKKILR